MRILMLFFGSSVRSLFRAVIATALFVPMAYGIPIDLTGATPTVTGPTTLHIDGIAAFGSIYWADFEWNQTKNQFDPTDYGEMAGPVFDEFDYGEDQTSHNFQKYGECSIGSYSCDTASQRIGSCDYAGSWVQITVAVAPNTNSVTLTYRIPWANTGSALYVDGVMKATLYGSNCNWQETVLTGMSPYTADGELDLKIVDELTGCSGDIQITYMEIYSE